jgi:hypothetical protein
MVAAVRWWRLTCHLGAGGNPEENELEFCLRGNDGMERYFGWHVKFNQ